LILGLVVEKNGFRVVENRVGDEMDADFAHLT